LEIAADVARNWRCDRHLGRRRRRILIVLTAGGDSAGKGQRRREAGVPDKGHAATSRNFRNIFVFQYRVVAAWLRCDFSPAVASAKLWPVDGGVKAQSAPQGRRSAVLKLKSELLGALVEYRDSTPVLRPARNVVAQRHRTF